MIWEHDPVTHLFALIGGIQLRTRRQVERALRPDLTWPQFGLLMAASAGQGATQRELGNRLESDATTVMVICDSLEKKDLVERRPDPADRRLKRIYLTRTGQKTLERAQAKVAPLYLDVAGRLSPSEVAPVVELLSRIFEHLKQRDAAQSGGNP